MSALTSSLVALTTALLDVHGGYRFAAGKRAGMVDVPRTVDARAASRSIQVGCGNEIDLTQDDCRAMGLLRPFILKTCLREILSITLRTDKGTTDHLIRKGKPEARPKFSEELAVAG